MNRRDFILNTSLGVLSFMTLNDLANSAVLKDSSSLMPVLFVGHGNPMNAIEDNEFSREWKKIGKELPKPKAILCISAHWETHGTKVVTVEYPKTIHDFYGFPKALFDVNYNVQGSPEIANESIRIVKSTKIEVDDTWGLDHGAWSVLKPMFPLADIPTFQLSLDIDKTPKQQFELAKELMTLRRKGVLIIGSGNIVHNLGLIKWQSEAHEWALEFDRKVKKLINQEDFASLVNYHSLGTEAKLSIPSNEHYLPMLYILALKNKNEHVRYFNEKIDAASISMTSFIVS